MRHIIPISGKDSLATAIVQRTRRPDLSYEYIFNPTGQEYPEVIDWLEKVEVYLGEKIIRIGRPLKQIIAEQNWFLPSAQARYCTRLSKITPMEKYLGKDEATIYFGIRADEDRGGYDNSSNKSITPAYPLKEIGVNLPMVYQINQSVELKPPTFLWKWLVDEVAKIINPELIKTKLAEWHFDQLFSWRSRANCANCFFQRQYEWVGLLEHYPEMFWEFEGWEHNVSEYYFLGKDKPLKWLIDNAERIKKTRLKSVVKTLSDIFQGKLFLDENDETVDLLAVTSCGLLCGK